MIALIVALGRPTLVGLADTLAMIRELFSLR
jgi:hypothetical protein